MPAMIFQNHASESGQHYLKIKLKEDDVNTAAIGSKVIVYACGHPHHLEVNPMRGFQSTVESSLTIGLGNCNVIDSVIVFWPNEKKTALTNLKSDTTLIINNNSSGSITDSQKPTKQLLIKQNIQLPYTHVENEYSDFNRDRLMFIMISNEGPHAAIQDLNKDGLEDIVIGGARGKSGAILFQQPGRIFKKMIPPDMLNDSTSEDIDIQIADINCDQLPDIYISSGSSELPSSSSAMKDRLYINEGHSVFKRKKSFIVPPTQVTMQFAWQILIRTRI
jgi:hypothetical protein